MDKKEQFTGTGYSWIVFQFFQCAWIHLGLLVLWVPAAVNLLLCSLLSGSQKPFLTSIQSCATENWRGVVGKGIKPSSVCSLGFCRKASTDRASPLSLTRKLFVFHLDLVFATNSNSYSVYFHSFDRLQKCKFLRQAPWEMQIWLKEQYQDSIVPDYEQNGLWTYPTILIEVNNIYHI